MWERVSEWRRTLASGTCSLRDPLPSFLSPALSSPLLEAQLQRLSRPPQTQEPQLLSGPFFLLTEGAPDKRPPNFSSPPSPPGQLKRGEGRREVPASRASGAAYPKRGAGAPSHGAGGRGPGRSAGCGPSERLHARPSPPAPDSTPELNESP